jgi:cellulose biosynthesis protein BcsQ
MNPLDLHHFIKDLFDWDVERITALSTGFILGILLTWTIGRSLLGRRGSREEAPAQILRLKAKRLAEQLQVKEAALFEQRIESEKKIDELHRQIANVLQSAHQQALELQKAHQELSRDRDEIRTLDQRLQVERQDKQQLQSTSTQLDRQKEEQKESITALQNNHQVLAERIMGLTNEKLELQSAVQTLQQKLDTQTDEVWSLNQRLQGEWMDKQQLQSSNWQLEQQRAEMQALLDEQQAKVNALTARLTNEKAEYQAAVQNLQQRLDAEGVKVRQINEQCERLKEENAGPAREELQSELGVLRKKVRLVTDLQGKVWEQPPAPDIPAFRTGRAGAKLIAVCNLKGGVGKTTLTANLGALLAKRGYRVLLVDLDYQQSLTTLCLRDDKAAQVRIFGRVVRHLFSSPQPLDLVAWQNLTDLDGFAQMHLLATDEWLVDEEEQAKFTWLLEPGQRDVRYLFRSAFHAPRFQQAFDVILFDCPPRLTTACVNALACSDYALIPVLLDKVAADAVPRLLHWLNRLQGCNVCPNLTRAGVLGNEGRPFKGDWTQSQRAILQYLKDTCPTGPVSVYHFEQVVPFKSEFAEAAEKHTFASLGKALAGVFSNLVDELIQGKVIHESPRLAAVP